MTLLCLVKTRDDWRVWITAQQWIRNAFIFFFHFFFNLLREFTRATRKTYTTLYTCNRFPDISRYLKPNCNAVARLFSRVYCATTWSNFTFRQTRTAITRNLYLKHGRVTTRIVCSCRPDNSFLNDCACFISHYNFLLPNTHVFGNFLPRVIAYSRTFYAAVRRIGNSIG